MIIYLVGFMGSGKTTFGKKLSEQLKYEFVDLDDLIEKKSKKKIQQIFNSKDGEKKFRSLESKSLKRVSAMKNTVVATGGGAACFNENMELMNRTGITVYLKMTPGGLFHRLAASKTTRPLISRMTDIELIEFIIAILPLRAKYYEKAAISVNGEYLRVKNVAERIRKFMQNMK